MSAALDSFFILVLPYMDVVFVLTKVWSVLGTWSLFCMSLTSFFHLECVLDSVVTMKTKGQTNYQILIPYILSIRILCINNMELNLIPSLLIDMYSSHYLSSTQNSDGCRFYHWYFCLTDSREEETLYGSIYKGHGWCCLKKKFSSVFMFDSYKHIPWFYCCRQSVKCLNYESGTFPPMDNFLEKSPLCLVFLCTTDLLVSF